VVGDDAQSIYSFRGANINNILSFTGQYPAAKLFKLEQNYRSTQLLVGAANSLIEKNKRQIRKEVFSQNEPGEAIAVLHAYSDKEEGEIVVNEIMKLHRREHDDYSHFAILYRTNAQSRIFEEVLRKRSIPYRIYGGLSFYQRKEIKDVIAYFRVTVNPNDEEAFKRIINYPARGIGDTTVSKLLTAATTHGISLWHALADPNAYGLNLNRGTLAKLQLFRDLIDELTRDVTTQNAYEKGTDIMRRSGIVADVYQDKTPENLSKQENLQELANSLKSFCEERTEEGNTNIALADFLSEVSLLTDQDSDGDDSETRVTLMTIHSAKGLEFKTVFVVGMEEQLFPSGSANGSLSELEEERRLFYVAITRAKTHCYLSYSDTRYRYGKMEFGTPSRFLRDIDSQYLRLPGQLAVAPQTVESRPAMRSGFKPIAYTSAPAKPSPTPVQPLPAPDAPTDAPLRVGQSIEHDRFGIGRVTRVEGTGDNAKATIDFQNAGEKQLLLRFARFKVIN
jgi:DNA helicase-2/ATP-dependent DNA helicase PcrA